jgi:hypothetical protein
MRVLLAILLALLASAAQAHPPYGLVADSRGNVYFSDLEAVWRLAPDGRLDLFRPASEGFHVHELTLAADGAVEGDVNGYDPATETFSTGLWNRSADGLERWLLEPPTAPPRGLGTFSDSRGNRYTAQWVSSEDRRTMLFRRSADERVDLLYGPSDAARRFRQVLISSVGGMAATADGGMLFADGRALRRVSSAGEVTTLHEASEGTAFRGISIAPDGRALAADFAGKAVVAVSSDGTAELLYREPDAWLPTAALIVGGRLLVLEANSDHHAQDDRVRLIEVADGRSRVVAQPGIAPAPRPAAGPPAAEGRSSHRGMTAAAAAAVALAAALVFVLARRFRS